jgi:uncharacterized protein
MTAQEQQMLQDLAERIDHMQLPGKDADAEQFIQQTLGRNPDALYIMAQTVLVQQYALDQAQRQLTDLRAQLDQARRQEPKHSGSFLGNLLGLKDEATHPAPPPPAQQYAPPAGYAAGAPAAGYPAAYPAGYPGAAAYPIVPPYPMAPQGGGFLRSALQTASGVAAGALAFEGVESLLHGFGHSGGYGGGFGDGRPEEIVNNYYGDSSPHEHTTGGSGWTADSHGLSDTSGNQLHDATYITAGPESTDLTTDPGNAPDTLSGTTGSDYSASADDSMLSDDVGDDQGSDGGFDSSGDSDSGGGDGF